GQAGAENVEAFEECLLLRPQNLVGNIIPCWSAFLHLGTKALQHLFDCLGYCRTRFFPHCLGRIAKVLEVEVGRHIIECLTANALQLTCKQRQVRDRLPVRGTSLDGLYFVADGVRLHNRSATEQPAIFSDSGVGFDPGGSIVASKRFSDEIARLAASAAWKQVANWSWYRQPQIELVALSD